MTAIIDQQKRALADLVRDALLDAIRRCDLSPAEVQEIIDHGEDLKKFLDPELISALCHFATPPNVVLVPDVSATELTTAFAPKLTYLDPDYANWDFYTDRNGDPVPGRGKRFEVRIWKPGRIVSSEEVREHFRQDGFEGHVGAFTQWFRRRFKSLHGRVEYATVPPESQCRRRHPNDSFIHVPHSLFDGCYVQLHLILVSGSWAPDWSFVGFREVSP